MTEPRTSTTPAPARPPYLAGDRVRILYMSERGTILADAYVSAVFPHPDGWEVITVMSDARSSFHLVPANEDALTITRSRVTIGIDHG